MKICGPKIAIFGLIMSAWGGIQLGLMGLFFWKNSVSLLEDLHLNHSLVKSPEEFYSKVNIAYQINAINCWGAACAWGLVLLFSAHQLLVNSRS